MLDSIRNFVIIAHIDHGKSTLADRLLETTGTIEARRMKPQYLDQLDLERERGITIKMAPVRMEYQHKNTQYILNLIDTPGHSDFSYEVSRALVAVEGAVLLVDAIKGIQAQTLSNLRQAQKAGLAIIGAVNKVDLDPVDLDKTVQALADLLQCSPEEIFRISAKTGQGVREILDAVVERVPAPKTWTVEKGETGALIFDSRYDDHKGILAYVRVGAGQVKAGDEVYLLATRAKVKVKEVGYFTPELKTSAALKEGETGYIATGLKEPALVHIGDTVAGSMKVKPFAGYREATPVVFISFYPDEATKYEDLKKGLDRLHLNDAALSFEPDANEALGRGLKVGFLGQLHFEITADRLKREFNLEFMSSFPSIAYRIKDGQKEYVVKQMQEWPMKPDKVFQPMIKLELLTPSLYLNQVVNLKTVFDIDILGIQTLANGSLVITARMPLAELIRDFDDQLKSVSAGYASFSYELDGEAEGDIRKMEIMLAGEVESALTRAVPAKDVEREARATVERLKKLLPQLPFTQAIQARVDGRIVARETIAALRKDVTGYLYGGDRTRKMKLWKKQKEGKKRLQERGKVNLPVEVFREILKK